MGGRHLALPLAEYAALGGFGRRNEAYLRVGLEVGEAAEALRRFQSGTLRPPRRVGAVGLALEVARSKLAPLFGHRRRALP